MLIRQDINGKIFIEQRTYFIYNSEEDVRNNRPAMVGSDTDLYFQFKRKEYLAFLKEELTKLAEKHNIQIRVGLNKTINEIIIEFPKDYFNSDNEDWIPIIKRCQEDNPTEVPVMVDGKNDALTLDEVYFEL